MITAVDANVLLDIFIASDRHGPQSKERLVAAYDAGAIVVSDVVYAELVPAFRDRAALDSALLELGTTLSPIDSSIAFEAGLRWKQYRAAGGPRNRIIADFLIGAHAMAVADVFLTRDRGFFSSYFPELYLSP
ncbi:MAG: type II toxin-antitoxin system VapC family toxin [Chloroflexi bacterium]|nr:type II toxin-antitoxin system VapC family toxin [Chloroflexota bacterium]